MKKINFKILGIFSLILVLCVFSIVAPKKARQIKTYTGLVNQSTYYANGSGEVSIRVKDPKSNAKLYLFMQDDKDKNKYKFIRQYDAQKENVTINIKLEQINSYYVAVYNGNITFDASGNTEYDDKNDDFKLISSKLSHANIVEDNTAPQLDDSYQIIAQAKNMWIGSSDSDNYELRFKLKDDYSGVNASSVSAAIIGPKGEVCNAKYISYSDNVFTAEFSTKDCILYSSIDNKDSCFNTNYSIKCGDNLNNTAAITQTVKSAFKYDNTKPTIDSSSISIQKIKGTSSKYVKNNDQIEFSFIANDELNGSGINESALKVILSNNAYATKDNGKLSYYSATHKVSVIFTVGTDITGEDLKKCQYTIYIGDNVKNSCSFSGNVCNSIDSSIFMFDNTAPTIDNITIQKIKNQTDGTDDTNYVKDNDQIAFSFSVNDDGSGVDDKTIQISVGSTSATATLDNKKLSFDNSTKKYSAIFTVATDIKTENLTTFQYMIQVKDNVGNKTQTTYNTKQTYFSPLNTNSINSVNIKNSDQTKTNCAKNNDKITISLKVDRDVIITSKELGGVDTPVNSNDNGSYTSIKTTECALGESTTCVDQKSIGFEVNIKDPAGNTYKIDTTNDGSAVIYYAPITVSNFKFESYDSENKKNDNNKARQGSRLKFSFTTNHKIFTDRNLDIEIAESTLKTGGKIVSVENTNGNNYVGYYDIQHNTAENTIFKISSVTVGDKAENSTTKTLKDVPDKDTKNNLSDLNNITYYAPIEIKKENIIVESNNKSGKKDIAKNDDIVTIKLSTTHPIYINNGSEISGETIAYKPVKDLTTLAQAAGPSQYWIAKYKVDGKNKKNVDNDTIKFEFTASDDARNDQVNKSQNDSAYKVKYYAPIDKTLNTLTLKSNNASGTNSIAKNGNKLTIKFSTIHPTKIGDLQIAGNSFTSDVKKHNFTLKPVDDFINQNEVKTDSSKYWVAEYTILDTDEIKDTSNIPFSFTVSDDALNDTIEQNQEKSSDTKVIYYAPIKISNVKIVTDNTKDGSKYAKDNNNVTVSFTTQHRTSISNAKIMGKNVQFNSSNDDGMNWSKTCKISNGDITDLGQISFEFTANDIALNTPQAKNYNDGDITNRIQYFAPIKAQTSIASDNNNKAYAKNGSNVIASIATNHNTSVTSGNVLNRQATSSGNDSNNLKVSYQIPLSENTNNEGIVNFNIEITDLAGNTLEITDTNDNPKSMVTYDRTQPAVEIKPAFNGFSNKNIGLEIVFSDTNLDTKGISLKNNGNELISDSEREAITAGSKSYTKQISLTDENEYNITGTITDLASNKCDRDISASVVIDKTNPKIEATKINLSSSMTFKKGFVISKYFNINGKYINDIICKVTDSNGTEQWNINKPINTDGKKTIYLLATDKAGNSSAALTYDLYIDGTLPKPELNEAVSKRELNKGINEESFISNMNLNLSLQKINIGNEKLDHFNSILLEDEDGKIIKDILKDPGSKQTDNSYALSLSKFEKYKLVLVAEDDVHNIITNEYKFELKDKPLYQKFYENKPVFYSSISGFGVVIVFLSIFILTRLSKGKKKMTGI